MNFGEYLKKYQEENTVIDLVPGEKNAKGIRPIKIKIGGIVIPTVATKSTPIDANKGVYKVLMDDRIISDIKTALAKSGKTGQEYDAFVSQLEAKNNQPFLVFLHTAELYYSTETKKLEFRQK